MLLNALQVVDHHFISERKALLINLKNRLSEKEIADVPEDIARKETKDFVAVAGHG